MLHCNAQDILHMASVKTEAITIKVYPVGCSIPM